MTPPKDTARRQKPSRPSLAYEHHRREIRAIVARHKGVNPRVFGSVARGEDTETSDLDLLVDSRPDGLMSLLDLCAIYCEIEDLLGVPVQVMTPGSLPPKILAQAEREARAV